MDWIIPVTPAEFQQDSLDPQNARAAYRTFAENGVLILRGGFPAAAVDQLYQEFHSRYGRNDLAQMQTMAQKPPPNPVMEVGPARFEIALRMTGAFGQPGLFGNPLLLNFLMPLLGGSEMRLSGFTAVASYPGARMQHIHRDHSHLFTEHPSLGPQLPVHAVNVSVPLIDVDLAIGPTAIWPGSHRLPDGADTPMEKMVAIPFQRGDCILIDYRTSHTGLPNRSQVMRPILYMVYARPWFFDDINHSFRSPLDMPIETFAALPPRLQPLLVRAYSQKLRAQMMSGLPTNA